jgi:hypothetical protein
MISASKLLLALAPSIPLPFLIVEVHVLAVGGQVLGVNRVLAHELDGAAFLMLKILALGGAGGLRIELERLDKADLLSGWEIIMWSKNVE